jgi:predicted ATPase/DNA-binding SARP family transcriptional activator
MPEVEFSILGPLVVRLSHAGDPIELSAKLRLLLARLLIEPGATIPIGVLGTDVWEEKPLKDQRNSVHAAIKLLRRRFEGARHQILSTDAGYRIVLSDPLRLDAERFRRLAARGRALAATHPGAARAMLAEAQAAWRGPVLGDDGSQYWAVGLREELHALRDSAEVDLNDVRLVLGEFADVEASLRRQLVTRELDARRHAQLVRALDGAGRTAEAGKAYRDAVRALGTPGPELKALSERVGRGHQRARAGRGGYRAGGPDEALLYAVLPEDRPLRPDAPGLGTLALIVDGFGGVARPTAERELVVRFETLDAAARAAAALAADDRLSPAMAVHSGAVILLDDVLAGAGPDRARLLARAAHPGQVLVSSEAYTGLRRDRRMLDRGEQRLEDLLGGEIVYELDTGAAPEDGFPPPATLSRLDHNLPVQQTRFVGRARELADLARSVGEGKLITLLGVGGCGKTRLALQLAGTRAARFPDGARFVELAELEKGIDPENLAVAIGTQLAIRPVGDEPASDVLVRELSDRSQLIVLDNCEHVLDACVELVSRLRAACSRLALIVTSREPLRLDDERRLTVPAMAVEDEDDPAGLPDAVELLLERAGELSGADAVRAVADATRICRALEGLPLAIELAAAHVSSLGLATVLAMLEEDDGFKHLASEDPSRPLRQRTIDATIAWSHDLLDDDQRAVLRRLAILRGSFGLAEAKLVGADERLQAPHAAAIVLELAERSMLSVEPSFDGAPRFRLSLPIRAFAAATMSAGERAATRARATRVYRGLVRRLAPDLYGPREHEVLERLELEHDNLRATLSWLVEDRNAEAALELAEALWWLWFSHGHFEEGLSWVQSVLELDARPSPLRVRVLAAGSHLAWWRGAYELTEHYNRALCACARAIDDGWGLAWAAMGMGALRMFREPARARTLFEESRRGFAALGHDWGAGYALQLIAATRWFEDDAMRARMAYEEAVEIFERLEHGSVLASVRRGAGLMAAVSGEVERGTALCLAALRFSESIGDRAGGAQALNFLGAISRDDGDREAALGHFVQALMRAREVGELWAVCSALDGIAGAACAFGEPELAVRLFARSERIAERSPYRHPPYEQRRIDADRQALMATLGPRAFERAATEGQLMTDRDALREAIAFAERLDISLTPSATQR